MRTIAAILFNDFETLDVFGPIEVFGRLTEHFWPEFYSVTGGIVTSSQRVQVATQALSDLRPEKYILLIPGGAGVKNILHDKGYINILTELARNAEFVLTVCTGSILFSKTGLLDGKKATSNKRLFAWAQKESPNVLWIKKSRWVRDANIYTSSGVSAGIDMALGFISDLIGYDIAKQQSNEIEYEWKENNEWDPFSNLY